MLQLLDLIGYVATFLGIISFLPQVIKIWKTKSAKDLSLMMWVILFFNQILWLVYGFLSSSLPIISGNIIFLILTSSIIILKLKYKS